MNTLIVIGWLSVRTAYLNMSREEAIRRYSAENSGEVPEKDNVQEFAFKDSFGVYNAWPQEEE